MSRRRATYQPDASASADELYRQQFGTRVYRAPMAVAITDADEIDVPSFWQSVALALTVNVVGMLAVAAATWRWLGA